MCLLGGGGKEKTEYSRWGDPRNYTTETQDGKSNWKKMIRDQKENKKEKNEQKRTLPLSIKQEHPLEN